jgi:hypothetical protein
LHAINPRPCSWVESAKGEEADKIEQEIVPHLQPTLSVKPRDLFDSTENIQGENSVIERTSTISTLAAADETAQNWYHHLI